MSGSRQPKKNKIHLLIEESGLTTSEFQWTDENSVECVSIEPVDFKVSVLTHRPTEYFCKFAGYSVKFSPAPKERVAYERHNDDFSRILSLTKQWLGELKKEVEAPDLWATISSEKALSAAVSSPNLDNSPLTPAEQSLIETKLDEIKAYILAGQHFTSEQAEFVQGEFAYLEESSRRFGRKDWLRVLMGVLVGQVFNRKRQRKPSFPAVSLVMK